MTEPHARTDTRNGRPTLRSAEPFRIEVPEHVLADLKERLARTRWPIEARAAPWRWGTSLDYLRAVVDRWRDGYDWRRWEAALNRWPQYRATIGGRKVHFVLEPGSGPRPLPLLITHGWPGSFAEFLDVIGPLAHPERHGGDASDAFTVVAPSIPGYAFSDPPDAPITPRDVAGLWRELMVGVVGCDTWVAQGGDWGAVITSWLALDHPGHVRAIHLNMPGLRPWIGPGSTPVDAEEAAWIAGARRRLAREGAYQRIQGTKPQTLAYALTDSPVGLAAWILEKFQGWTAPGVAAAPPFDTDWLITNVMLYWLGGMNAAMWLYCSLVDGTAAALGPGQRVETPTGLLLFPDDLVAPPPARWIERAYHVVHRRDADAGGHFAALENGAALVDDVRAFFRRFR